VADSRQDFQYIFLLGFLKTACMGWEAGDGSVEIEPKFLNRHTVTYLL